MAEERDPLLAEMQGDEPLPLNAAATIITEGQDPKMHPAALAAAEASVDPLAVPKPLPPKPHVAAMDAKHATAAGGRGYAVLVRGDYFAPAQDVPGKKILKPYEITVNVTQLDGALSVIKNKALEPLLRKKYTDFLGVRTHTIVEARPLGGAPESSHLAYCSREKLEEFIREQRIPVDPAEYPGLEVLRATVIDYHLNPNGFEKREAARQADRKETLELAKLNPDLIGAPAV